MQQEWRQSHCDIPAAITQSLAYGGNLVHC